MSSKLCKTFFIAFLIIGGFLFLGKPEKVSAEIIAFCCCNDGSNQGYAVGTTNGCNSFCGGSENVQSNFSYDSISGSPLCVSTATIIVPDSNTDTIVGGATSPDWISCGYCDGIAVSVLPPDACPDNCTAELPASVDTPPAPDNCPAECADSSDRADCEDVCRSAVSNAGNTLPTDVDNTNQNKLPGADNTRQISRGQGGASLPNFLGISSVKELFLKIVQFIIDIAKPFAVLMLIWSGFLFVTAQGNDTKLTAAKKNLVWTIAGIAVIIAADLIVSYIMEALGVASAGTGSALLVRVKALLNQIIGLLFVLVTVYFGWGVTEFVRASATGGKGVEEGKKHMIWGIIGMTVMLGAWVIVGMLQSFFK